MFILVINSSGWGRHRAFRELAVALHGAVAMFAKPEVFRVQIITETGDSIFEQIKASDPDQELAGLKG